MQCRSRAMKEQERRREANFKEWWEAIVGDGAGEIQAQKYEAWFCLKALIFIEQNVYSKQIKER